LAGAGLSILFTVVVDVVLTRRRTGAFKKRQVSAEAEAGTNPISWPDYAPEPNEATSAEAAVDVT